MNETARNKLENCIALLERGSITEADLRDLAAASSSDGQRQELLYLQTATTSVTSEVIGMSLVAGGKVSDGAMDATEWPYKTVLEAMEEGWRVVRFPVQLPAGHTQDAHITCEFVLERWRP